MHQINQKGWRLIDETSPKLSGLKHICTCNCEICFNFLFYLFQLCCTSLKTLTFYCTFCSQKIWIIFLPSNTCGAANPRELQIEMITDSITLLVNALSSNFIFEINGSTPVSQKFSIFFHLEIDMIDLGPWRQFFSDSLELIKVASCCLKWHSLIIILQFPHLLKTWGGHLHKSSFERLLMYLFQIFTIVYSSPSESIVW